MSTSSTTRYEELAVRAADGLLTAGEHQELETLLDGHPERQAESKGVGAHYQ